MGTVPHRHKQGNTRCAPPELKSAVPMWHSLGMARPRHFIRAYRKKAGLSQEIAAERIGIARSYLSKIETGKRRYDELFLESAAKVYRCTPADLIGRHPDDLTGTRG